MKTQLLTKALQYITRAGFVIAAASLPVLAQLAGDPSPAVELVPFDRFVADIANALSSAAVADSANCGSRKFRSD